MYGHYCQWLFFVLENVIIKKKYITYVLCWLYNVLLNQ